MIRPTAALLPDDASDAKTKVVRSRKLNVYFRNNEYLLVRPAQGQDGERVDLDAQIYELRREVVRLVHWRSD